MQVSRVSVNLREPQGDFARCVVHRVRAVDQVLHVGAVPRAAQVSADRARGRRRRVGRSHEDAHALDDALAFDDRDAVVSRANERAAALRERGWANASVLGVSEQGGHHVVQVMKYGAAGSMHEALASTGEVESLMPQNRLST